MRTILTNSIVTAKINHKGAELISLKKNITGREYMWEGDVKHWGKHSPILFPIVGTLRNNSYTHNTKEYRLPRHGFARDLLFTLISETGNQAIFSLQSDEETKKIYPFDFELQLLYSIDDTGLQVSYRVLNKSAEAIYYSIGGHPAFALPGDFEKYSLEFEPNETLVSYQLENDLLSDKTEKIRLSDNKLPLTYSLFEKDALIFKELQSKQIKILENGKPILNFTFNDFPNFGIWTKVGAPFICLEPWLGYSDVGNASGNLADKEGIQKLEANHMKEYGFSIEIL